MQASHQCDQSRFSTARTGDQRYLLPLAKLQPELTEQLAAPRVVERFEI
jgi:hypothetical protein